jgi:uncharacterized protein YoxC
MSIATLVGLTAAEKDAMDKLDALVPGILGALASRETQLLASIQPTIDEVKQTIEAVKADVVAAQALITSINAIIVPGVAAVLQTIEQIAQLIEQISGRLEWAVTAFAKGFGQSVSNEKEN